MKAFRIIKFIVTYINSSPDYITIHIHLCHVIQHNPIISIYGQCILHISAPIPISNKYLHFKRPCLYLCTNSKLIKLSPRFDFCAIFNKTLATAFITTEVTRYDQGMYLFEAFSLPFWYFYIAKCHGNETFAMLHFIANYSIQQLFFAWTHNLHSVGFSFCTSTYSERLG